MKKTKPVGGASSSRPAAKTTTNQTQAAKPNSRKEHVCTTSKPVPGAGVKQRPPLKSRISFSEANKSAKPSGAASSIKSSASSKVATTPASGNLVKTEKKNSNLEADKLYAQIKQNLEVKKNAARLQSMGFKGNFKQSESSNHFVLLGDVTKPLPKTSKIVRLFTSSTFTDTMLERNMLLEKTFPQIKLFCQARGYEFQVVDMRWGVRDESTDDHMGTELCLKELIQCRDISTGPIFVTLLSHKYGYCALPREIQATEFEKLLKSVKDKDKLALLKKWFVKDDNSVPAMYVLQSISTIFPEFLSSEDEKRLEAKKKWWEDNDAMQEALYSAAKKALGDTEAEKYVISVTEKEVKQGLLDIKDANKHCLWFQRTLRGIDKAEPSRLVSRYTECLGSEEKLKKVKMLMSELKEKKIPKLLPAENTCTYTIDWTGKGIDPENSQHKEYLVKMTTDFKTQVCQLIERGIQGREEESVSTNNVLFEECLQHLRFTHEKSKNFHGREAVLKKTEAYLSKGNNLPLIIHGESGSGKTSIMAKTAMMTASETSNAVVIIRFLGTTPRSSDIISLLRSICNQIKTVYGDTSVTSEDPKELVEEFQRCLQELPKPDKELVLLLDSMDQLDPSHQGRQLGWMPTSLSEHVKFIVSTLEEEKYECFPALKFLYPVQSNYIAVEKLPEVDVKNIIDSWFKEKHRTLTSYQMDLLTRSFDQCPLPLNLKLSFDEACRWTSFAAQDSTRLQTTIRASINRLFFRLERKHGELFVSKTLGYITAAKSGLSEGELEDILACDDDVLNDVYTYWTPPLRRLPPLLLLRLKADLNEYIVERGADGMTVMYWYHRQFIQAAMDRYCENAKILHEALADFFSGKWSNGIKKPYKDKSGKAFEEDRLVAAQPLMFGSTFNVRKLNNLPYHRIKAEQIEALKTECLYNFKFIFCKLLATSCSNVLSDFSLASEKTNDKQISIIRDTLQLSEHALIFDKMLLVPQLLDRLSEEKSVASFLSQMDDYPFSFLFPRHHMLAKPGGSLVFSLSGHTADIISVDMKQDGVTAVTCAKYPDNSIKLWDVKNGKLLKSIDSIAPRAVKLYFVCNDTIILAHFHNKIVGLKESGEILYTIPIPRERTLFCPADKGRVVFLVFQDNTIEWFDAKSGKKTETIICPEGVRFGDTGVAVSSKTLVAATVEPREKFIVLDLITKQVSLYDVPYPEEVIRRHIIKSLAILPDERHVIFSIRFDNDIRFLDVSTMKEDRIIKGSKGDFTLGQFVLSPDGTELFYQVGQSVCTWNLKTEKLKMKYLHPCYVFGIASTDWKTMVTISNTPILRVWDITKKVTDKNKIKATGAVKGLVRMYDYGPTSSPRYLLGLAQLYMLDRRQKGEEEDFGVVAVDLLTGEVCKKGQLNEKPRLLEILNDKEVIICSSDRKLRVFDLGKMEITRSFQGKMFEHIPFTPYGYVELVVLKDRGELVTVTKGRKHFKIYDIKNGKTKAIIKCPSEGNCRLKGLKACYDGSVVIAHSTADKFFILDTVNSKFLGVVGEDDFKCQRIFEYVHLTSSGNTALFSVNSTGENVWSMQLYRVREGKVGVKLTDNGYPDSLQYEARFLAVPNVRNLEDWGFVTSYLDNVIRVWDATKGTILHRLGGHAMPVTLPLMKKGSKYFVTHCRRQENTLRVWDIKTMDCVAAYKMEGNENMVFEDCEDLKSFFSIRTDPVHYNHWSLKGLGCDTDLQSLPVIYTGKQHSEVDLSVPTPHPDDAMDPDDDPDEEDEFDED